MSDGDPPTAVRDIELWRLGRAGQDRHRAVPGDHIPVCGRCGTEWPCRSRRAADRAVGASFHDPDDLLRHGGRHEIAGLRRLLMNDLSDPQVVARDVASAPDRGNPA